MKKIIAILILICLVLPIFPLQVKADSNDIIVTLHYQRDDDDYSGWDVWGWAMDDDGDIRGGDGFAFEANSFGMMAKIPVPAEATRVGFIIRENGWNGTREPGGDRHIHLNLGDEVWVYSGEEEFVYDAPPGYGVFVEYDELEVNIHRHRYDNNYNEEAAEIQFEDGRIFDAQRAGTSAYGTVYKALLTDVNSDLRPKLSFGNGDEYEIVLSKTKKDISTLNVYSIQGRTRLGYEENDMSFDKVMVEATINNTEEIYVRLSYPLFVGSGDSFGTIKNAAGENIGTGVPVLDVNDSIYNELAADYATMFILSPDEGLLALNEEHTVVFTGYGELRAVLSRDFFGTKEFEEMFTYGGELGAIYAKDKTVFRLWAPTASKVLLNLYPDGHKSELLEAIEMTYTEKGVWEAEQAGDIKNTYYTYTVTTGSKVNEAIDPYAKAAGVNGMRGMVVDLASTNPEGWENSRLPAFGNPVDAVIYELHVRDLSTAANSGISEKNKGKYLAFTETGTKSPEGLKTGIDHMVELGITHVQLLPVFDFRTVDETKLDSAQFNWGYDPVNFNLPEGSYSTDPYDGNVRINEFKQMVKSLHDNGIRVIMDVVYNHTSLSSDSHFELLMPGYYFRFNPDGSFSNGSGVGNETASERSMVRKMIVDSVVYWVNEYHIDGFRFDLMGIHDIETMNAIRAALDEIDPSIILYGEGWTGGDVRIPAEQQALKRNMAMLDERIGAFSDDIRDGMKGPVYPSERAIEPGFIDGGFGWREDVKFGIAASVFHPQIDYAKVFDSKEPWALAPSQTITYNSCHDNHTLWDKFEEANRGIKEADRVKLNKLAAFLTITSQGVTFLHAGEDLARTKYGDHNSYQSADAINQLDWKRKANFNDLFEYYQGLLALRKAYPAFRMQTADDIAANINFIDDYAPEIIAYTLNGNANGGNAGTIAVVINASDDKAIDVNLKQDGWDIYVDGEKAGTEVLNSLSGDTLKAEPKTAYLLVQNDKVAGIQDEVVNDGTPLEIAESEKSNLPVGLIILITVGVAALIGVALFIYLKKRRS